MEKIEVYHVGGSHDHVSEEELRNMIKKELAKGFEPTVNFFPDGTFIFNFYEVVKTEE